MANAVETAKATPTAETAITSSVVETKATESAPAKGTQPAAVAQSKQEEKPIADTVLVSGDAAEKKADDKPAEAKKAEEKIALKVPEGSLLKASAADEIASFAKERGLSKEHAQAILDREHQSVNQYAMELREEMLSKRTEWLAEAKSDKEFGGEHFKENVEMAKRGFTKYATEAMKKFANESGLGNNVEFLKSWAAVGKAIEVDKMVLSGVSSSDTPKDPLTILYGSQNTQ